MDKKLMFIIAVSLFAGMLGWGALAESTSIRHDYTLKSCSGGVSANEPCSIDADCQGGICLDSAIACYSFEEGALGSDSCGSNTMSPVDGPTTSLDSQWSSSSVSFNNPRTGQSTSSNSQHLQCQEADCPELDLTGSDAEVSVVAWMKPKTCDHWSTIYARGWDLFLDLIPAANNRLRLQLRPNGCSTSVTLDSAQPVCAANQWTHVAGVANINELRSYVNGLNSRPASPSQPYPPGTSGLCDTANEMTIGTFLHTDWMDGLLDEVAIFDSALSAEQVCEICRFGLDGTHTDRSSQCGNCTPPPARIVYGPQGLVGPPGEAALTCPAVSNCYVCDLANTPDCMDGLGSASSDWESQIESATAGDTILLKAGTYTPATPVAASELNIPAGTPSAKITVANYNGEDVAIDGRVAFTNNCRGSIADDGDFCRDAIPCAAGGACYAGHVVLQGFTIHKDATSATVRLKRTNWPALEDIAIENNAIYGGRFAALRVEGNVNNVKVDSNIIDGGREGHSLKILGDIGTSLAPSDIAVSNNRFSKLHWDNACDATKCDVGHCNSDADCSNCIGTAPYCVASLQEDLVQLEGHGDNILIDHNSFDNNPNGEDCLDVKSGGSVTIRGNYVNAVGCRAEGMVIQGEATGANIVEENYIIGNASDGISVGAHLANTNVVVRNNVLDSAMLRIRKSKDVVVAYNTLFGQDNNLRIGISGTDCPTNAQIINNIFSGTRFDVRDPSECVDLRCRGGDNEGNSCVTDVDCPGGGACVNNAWSSYSASSNITYNTTGDMLGDVCVGGLNAGAACDAIDDCDGGSCVTQCVNCISTDPQLTNYHIGAISPARDAADPSIMVAADFEGDSRPQGSGWDIGADEFIVGGCSSGDINCDGTIADSADIQLVVNVWLGLVHDSAIIQRADLNSDTKVDASDIQAIVNMRLGV